MGGFFDFRQQNMEEGGGSTVWGLLTDWPLKNKKNTQKVAKEMFPQQNRRGVWGVGRRKRYLNVKRGGGEGSSMEKEE